MYDSALTMIPKVLGLRDLTSQWKEPIKEEKKQAEKRKKREREWKTIDGDMLKNEWRQVG